MRKLTSSEIGALQMYKAFCVNFPHIRVMAESRRYFVLSPNAQFDGSGRLINQNGVLWYTTSLKELNGFFHGAVKVNNKML